MCNCLSVKLNGKIAHPGDVAFGNDDFIQSFEGCTLFPVAPQARMQHCSGIEGMAVIAPAVERCVEICEPNLGEESEKA